MGERARTLLIAMPGWPPVLMLAASPAQRPPAVLAVAIGGLSILLAIRLRRRLLQRADRRTFLELLGAAATGFSGWALTLVDVLNRSPDLGWAQLAAPGASVSFTIYGASLLIPMIVGYSAWGYCVFHGRLANDEGSLL